MSPNTALESAEFAVNPDPRCPCVLLLDVSASMSGKPIDALNEGLQRFQDEIQKDELAARRCDIAVVTFSTEVKVVQDFVTGSSFEAPRLGVEGLTYMGTGIQKALDIVEDRKAVYRQNGVDLYRPWVIMITDGAPQGEDASEIQVATDRVRQAEGGRHASFWAVGVEGADMEVLKSVSVKPPMKLAGLQFQELFQWLSDSLSARSSSGIGDQVELPPTDSWGMVQA